MYLLQHTQPGYIQQWCTFTLNQPGYLEAITFQTRIRDGVIIEGSLFSGTVSPNGMFLSAGQVVTWLSKGASTLDGMELCLVDTPPEGLEQVQPVSFDHLPAPVYCQFV